MYNLKARIPPGRSDTIFSNPNVNLARASGVFPLLDNFVDELHTTADNESPKPLPDAIALILTEQSYLFPSSRDHGIKSPYWRDTCTLKPILERYFKTHFPESLLDWIVH